MYLFNNLVRHWGNISTAVSKCKIARKTPYDWQYRIDSSVRPGYTVDATRTDIKYDTKVKILEESIQTLPVDTSEYLTKRVTSSCTDLLMSYLTILYEMTTMSKSEEIFRDYALKFNQAISNFSGLIYENLEYEVSDMIGELKNFTDSHGFHWDPAYYHLYNVHSIQSILTEVVKFVLLPQDENPNDVVESDLAERLQIPVHIIQEVLRTYDSSKSNPYPKFFEAFGNYVGGSSTSTTLEPTKELPLWGWDHEPSTATIIAKKTKKEIKEGSFE